MAGRIVVDVRTLAMHSQDLAGLAQLTGGQANALRVALGFLVNHPQIPNQASVAYAYGTSLRTLDEGTTLSAGMARAVAVHAQRVVDCEDLLRTGDGPTVRPGAGRGRGIPWGAVGSRAIALGRGTWGFVDALAMLAAPWSARAIAMRTLNRASKDFLKGLPHVSNKAAGMLMKARTGRWWFRPRFSSYDDLKGLGLGAQRMGQIRGDLEALGTWERARLAQQLKDRFGRVGQLSGKAGGIAGKLAPLRSGVKFVGKALPFVDLVDSTRGLAKEWSDGDHDDPTKLGGDDVEDTMTGVKWVGAAGGTLVAVGLVSNPVGIAIVGGIAVVVTAYEVAPYVWKGTKWVAKGVGKSAEYVWDKAGDLKDAAADKAGDMKDAVVDKADDLKDAAKDKADDLKDAAKDKADDMKDAVGDKLGGFKNKIGF